MENVKSDENEIEIMTQTVGFPRIRSLWYGLSLPYHAIQLIVREKSLLLLSFIPIFITLIVYIYVIIQFQSWAKNFIDSHFIHIGWQGWFAWIINAVTRLIVYLAAALTFAFSSSIVAAPFNDLLAEKTENFSDPPLPQLPKNSFFGHIKLILIDIIKTIVTAIVGVLFLLLSLIPVVNIIAFVMLFLLISFQFLSYPQTRRGIGLKEGSRFVKHHFFACVGFGITTSFLLSLPLISTIALPIAVVSGTLLAGRAPGSDDKFRLK